MILFMTAPTDELAKSLFPLAALATEEDDIFSFSGPNGEVAELGPIMIGGTQDENGEWSGQTIQEFQYSVNWTGPNPQDLFMDGITIREAVIGDPGFQIPDPVEPKRISRIIVIDRLAAAGLFDAAYAGLTSNVLMYERWQAVSTIGVEDTDVLNLLNAIGADTDQILAPEEN